MANSAFSAAATATRRTRSQPTLPERSGSPDSLANWETLGSEGRDSSRRGSTAPRIGEVNGKPAREPIRVYAGLESADGAEAHDRCGRRRTGAHRRFRTRSARGDPTTGTGWVNPTAPQAVELMFGGDTALVATPVLVSAELDVVPRPTGRRREHGRRTLIDKVHDRWSAQPEDTRPKLLVYGESLGSQGPEGAFAGLADIRNRTDGVLWVGPPNSNRLWREFVTRRDPAPRRSTPIYADGLVGAVRRDADQTRPADAGLDRPARRCTCSIPPIRWCGGRRICCSAVRTGLREKRGPDVSPAMSWYPIVTFWQVAADLPRAQTVSGRTRPQLRQSAARHVGRGGPTTGLHTGIGRPDQRVHRRIHGHRARVEVTNRAAPNPSIGAARCGFTTPI